MEFPLHIPKGKGPAFERVSIDQNTYRVMLVLVLFTGVNLLSFYIMHLKRGRRQQVYDLKSSTWNVDSTEALNLAGSSNS